MTQAKTEKKKLFSTSEIEQFRVRDGLVVKLTREKTYKAGEYLEMNEKQYKDHAHQVESEERYQARQAMLKLNKSKEK